MNPIVDQIVGLVTETNDQMTPKVRRSSANKSVEANNKERKKRKRRSNKRQVKNKEEVERQRMNHIAVERNRRRQMNDHLNVLRSLMPPSYLQRGDQASIVGGAIDYVKQLEQLLQTLQTQKTIIMSQLFKENDDVSPMSSSSSSSSAFHLKYSRNNTELSVQSESSLAQIQVVVIRNHVNLKIQCQRRSGLVLKLMFALEDLGLSVLHLNIISGHSFVHFSFSLKVEEDCKLGSAEEVASAVHHIFTLTSSERAPC